MAREFYRACMLASVEYAVVADFPKVAPK